LAVIQLTPFCFCCCLSVNVNCGHLHPAFGNDARQSPYPTVVVEVQSRPQHEVVDAVASHEPNQTPAHFARPKPIMDDDELYPVLSEVAMKYLKMLEALFTKSTMHIHDDADPDHVLVSMSIDGKSIQIEENIVLSPLALAQNWITQHDPRFHVTSSTFAVSKTKHVDEAYEFIFTSLATQSQQFLNKNSQLEEVGVDAYAAALAAAQQKRLYLVLPDFIKSSATSFEKFQSHVDAVIQALPRVHNHVAVEVFHPESLDANRRAPMPILCLQWKD
jgi:hypothetical protein